VRLPLRGRCTCDSDYVRFLFPRQFPPGARPRCLLECPQICLDKSRARARHGGSPHIQRGRNGVIAQPGRRFEQHARPRQFAGACLTTTEQVF
jgi:hypothetical protein